MFQPEDSCFQAGGGITGRQGQTRLGDQWPLIEYGGDQMNRNSVHFNMSVNSSLMSVKSFEIWKQ